MVLLARKGLSFIETTAVLASFTLPFVACSVLDDKPSLTGQHFRITAVTSGSFLNITENDNDARLSFSGYLIDMMETISTEANFTYELLTPSGFGSHCFPQRNDTGSDPAQAYGNQYHAQFDCGSDDVNELQGTEYSTDMYLGLFYVSPERQRKNWFTVPFQPPFRGTLAMYGTATGIPTIEDLIKQQALGIQPPACMVGSTANVRFIQDSFPDIEIKELYGEEVASIDTEECPVSIFAAPGVAQLTLSRFLDGNCLRDGKPVGMIGEPMDSGLSHYAIGVGTHLDPKVVRTLSYWMNLLMVDGTLAELYKAHGGTGRECGYVLFPPEENSRLLSEGAIAGVVMGTVAAIAVPLYLWYQYRLRQQEKRYKKRFVQQIARNIDIGRRPGYIAPGKLSEQILHIGQGKDFISRSDLSKWLHDIKMDFISERDFNALWNAMDVDGKGEVNAVDFVVFLSACGPEFEKVYEEQENMPKMERLKLAARRLSIITRSGEDGVRQIERNCERISHGRLLPSSRSVSTTSHHSDSEF